MTSFLDTSGFAEFEISVSKKIVDSPGIQTYKSVIFSFHRELIY